MTIGHKTKKAYWEGDPLWTAFDVTPPEPLKHNFSVDAGRMCDRHTPYWFPPSLNVNT